MGGLLGSEATGFGSVRTAAGGSASSAAGAAADGAMLTILRKTTDLILPPGYVDFFTDYNGPADHGVSFSLNATSVASVPGDSSKRRLTTQATGPGVAECMPYYNQASTNLQLTTAINPKTTAWRIEGRAAIETHAASNVIFPCCLALTTGGTMNGVALTNNTIIGLGLLGSNNAGGNNNFLSLVAVSSGVILAQTTTIPWNNLMNAYLLHYDGARTVTAIVIAPDGTLQTWTTQNLNQFPTPNAGQIIGFHPNQWLMCVDNTPTSMLVDYLYGAGPRI